MEFICYSKCSTCKKARDYLIKRGISFKEREIKEDTPSFDEIKSWVDKYSIDINKLFNTSGMVYRSMNLKDKISNMSDKEKLDLLSSNGMLIKRPILILSNNILIGFKESVWDDVIVK